MNGWVWHEKVYADNVIPNARNGWGHVDSDVVRPVVVKHVIGFTRPDWGEGNWTAKDLR